MYLLVSNRMATEIVDPDRIRTISNVQIVELATQPVIPLNVVTKTHTTLHIVIHQDLLLIDLVCLIETTGPHDVTMI